MNLKEAFRYQSFLDGMMHHAAMSLQNREHCLVVTKTHLRSKENPDAADFTEQVEVDEYFNNDDVISFMEYLIREKYELTVAIDKAKASIDFDIDAATAQNKFRQTMHNSIRNMLSYAPYKRVERGTGYKFNVEGNQTEYRYDVEVSSKESYDKNGAKSAMRNIIASADAISTKIDAAKINTTVDYTPPFDVNESFDDVMTVFIKSKNDKAEC